MKKKWWIVIVLLIAFAVGLAIAIPALMPPTPGVTYANYSRIELGMTRQQVESLLGESSEKLPEQIRWFGMIMISLDERDHPPGSSLYFASGSDDIVAVRFDEHGRVTAVRWNGSDDDRNSLEKLRDRIPWFAKPAPPLRVNYL